ncbi:guanylate cyclase 32E-like [Haliotis rufescens]|uniref:guanylate cyclase 32E-like n=1 Tax=Haliotis rufescens TaxID=6454 RepID=UPI00201F890A|nr:guanylate cyclase 32E-like [Haliotis rufescens]XP_048248098.1 guanylate cyclase 32E-like [Haliotis rufescens]XP_048248099.1 guanylate cyclase 32E-like [Haliotis rufescens]
MVNVNNAAMWSPTVICWVTVMAVGVLAPPTAANTTITLAYLTEHKGGFKHVGGAFFLAMKDHKQMLSKHGVKIEYVLRDTHGSDVRGYKQMMEVAASDNVTAFFGPDRYCSCIASVATALDIPYIAYDCVYTPSESNMKKYHVVSTQPSDVKVAPFIISFLKYNNWTSYTIISGLTDRWKETTRVLGNLTSEIHITDVRENDVNDRYFPGVNQTIFENMIRSTRDRTRIYVFLGDYASLIQFVMAMQRLGLTKTGEYAVIATDLDRKSVTYRQKKFFQTLKEEHDMKFIPKERLQAFQNVVILMRLTNGSTEWNEMDERIGKRNMQEPINFAPYQNLTSPSPLKAAYLYDAVKLYIKAVARQAEAKGDIYNATAIVEQMRNRSYTSIYGFEMHIDEKGDNVGNYSLMSVEVGDDGPKPKMKNVGMFKTKENNSHEVIFLPSENNIGWILGKPPPSEPECGFHGDKCAGKNYVIIISCSITAGIALIFVVLIVRHYLYEQKLDRLLWKIDRTEIQFISEPSIVTNRKPSKHYHRLISLLTSKDSEMEDLCEPPPRAEHELSVGMYRGTQVVIKQMTKKSLEVTRAMKKQLLLRKELNQENICRFVGVCIETPQIHILSHFCPRHSLHDIIRNKDPPLDDMFVSSLLADLIRGMTFIHDSRIVSHGNLKSSNCLVDSRWVLQITDFGLYSLFSSSQSSKHENKYYTRLKWKAPELLQDGVHEPRGTQKGDVYAFALILYDIHSRKGPWGDTDLTAKEVVQRVRQRTPNKPFRPPTDTLKCQPYIIECMRDCWAEYPDVRPDFKMIKQKLRVMHHGLKNNIFDNMLALMEKYATTLEKQVAERTVELSMEKKLTENLLLRMLPRSVADSLKQNKPVIPEQYECVSIYFSDIVGFTSIAAQSTPIQVVHLLNDLYIVFDSVIEHYDVYKVETIGDAYMVVSGLPIRNEDRHAGEVASLSLHLLSRIKSFRINHMPEASIRIRIGLHSGSCCAGVVGLKMPRYCLFGDTVNTASRMESTGEAMKIHCSHQCKDKLDHLGGYCLQERGIVSMKGKGEQKTYFLTGEDTAHRIRRISEEAMGRDGRCVSVGNLDYGEKPFSDQSVYRNSYLTPNANPTHRNSCQGDRLPVTQEVNSAPVDPDSSLEEPGETLHLLSAPDAREMTVVYQNGGRTDTRLGRSSLSCDDMSVSSGHSMGPIIYSRSNSRT